MKFGPDLNQNKLNVSADVEHTIWHMVKSLTYQIYTSLYQVWFSELLE